MKLKFCGAAREVTGSSHLLILDDGFRILLDCGLYQGNNESMENFNDRWLFEPGKLDCLIVSHAHIDHTGRIPKLVGDGFVGKIYSTHATRDLCGLMLLDSAKIQEGDAAYNNKKRGFNEPEEEPLYTLRDVQQTMRHFISHEYEQWFRIHPKVKVLFRDAGHILGSASVTLEIERDNGTVTRFGFTGDIGRPGRPILGDPLPLPEVDYLICESTYGDRHHEDAPNEIEHFIRVIQHTCIEKKGKVIIPAFSVGRTQEIVYMLDQVQKAGKLPHVPVYVDSPLAVNATEIFINHPECFDEELHRYMVYDENPFGFNNLFYIRDAEASKKLNSMDGAAIIISASGMMNAGRIRHHLLNNVENARNTFLMVGYCSPGTPGAALRDGARSIHIMGQHRQVLAQVEVMDSFSAHGDQSEMFDIIKNQRATAKNVWLVHGTDDRLGNWQQFLLDQGFAQVTVPGLGDVFELE
jgi:metallo-beta-lactamase family protein